jgi:DNA invertase Pin-like site-specific DNA recombinase
MEKTNSTRAAIYARYSSDLQSASSIEDQLRLCAELADNRSWQVVEQYTDAGLSGASLMRPGIQALVADALSGKFDILVAEALDRISRDQEDIAGVYKRMEFAGVEIVTLSEAAWRGGAAKGATGRPVGLLVQFLLGQAAQAPARRRPKARTPKRQS